MSEIGERLKLIRQELGLTQTQVANMVGIRPQHINGIERGSKTPSDLLIKSICRELGIQEEWLRHGQDPISTPIEKEMIKIMARYGKRAFLEQCIKLTQKEGDVLLHNQLKESLDSLNLSNLYRMVQFLIETYTNSGQKNQHWMEVQFERAFPEFKETISRVEYKPGS